MPSGKAGKYLVSASVGGDDNTSGYRVISVASSSGINYSVTLPPSSVAPTRSITTIFNLSVGAYIEIFVYQNSGGTQTFYSGSGEQTFCNFVYLGA